MGCRFEDGGDHREREKMQSSDETGRESADGQKGCPSVDFLIQRGLHWPDSNLPSVEKAH